MTIFPEIPLTHKSGEARGISDLDTSEIALKVGDLIRLTAAPESKNAWHEWEADFTLAVRPWKNPEDLTGTTGRDGGCKSVKRTRFTWSIRGEGTLRMDATGTRFGTGARRFPTDVEHQSGSNGDDTQRASDHDDYAESNTRPG